MSSHNDYTIRLDQLTPHSKTQVTATLTSASVIRVKLPLHSIGFTSSHVDVAHDWLDALFVGESLYPVSEHCKWEYERDDREHKSYVAFVLAPRNREQFIEQLFRFAPWFNSESFPQNQIDSIRDEIADLQAELPFHPVHFVEIADSYMINMIWGVGGEQIDGFFEGSKEQWSEYFPEQPEARFGYFRSPISYHIGGHCFSSIDDWVLEARVPITALVSKYGPNSPSSTTLMSATLIQGENKEILTNGSAAIHLERKTFVNALKMLSGTEKESSPAGLHSFELSANGDILVANLQDWKVVQFQNDRNRLGQQDLENLLFRAETSAELLRSCLGRPTAVRCDWSSMSDESFERLCCDVLCESGHYEPATLRKMGLSRSRDGGRDIVITRRPFVAGDEPAVFIFQCKNTRSLGGRFVAVSDVVDQYASRGFGVMTSGLIDATLYDKLDSIGKNRQIRIDTWDQLRLERFLSERHNLHIRDRYFDRQGKPKLGILGNSVNGEI